MKYIDKLTSTYSINFKRNYSCLFTGACLLFVAASMILSGCSTVNDPEPGSEVAALDISPDSISINVGESVDFSVAALNDSGDPVRNADLDFRWRSNDESVFTVEDDGTATAQDSGSARFATPR